LLGDNEVGSAADAGTVMLELSPAPDKAVDGDVDDGLTLRLEDGELL